MLARPPTKGVLSLPAKFSLHPVMLLPAGLLRPPAMFSCHLELPSEYGVTQLSSLMSSIPIGV